MSFKPKNERVDVSIFENIDYFISFKDICQIEEICKKTHHFYHVLEHIRKRCISLTGATIILCRASWDHTHYTRDTQRFWKYWLFHWFYMQKLKSKKWEKIWISGPELNPLNPPWGPLFSCPKCSWYNEILTFLTFGHFWEEFGRHRILTVFDQNKTLFPWNHEVNLMEITGVFVTISKTLFCLISWIYNKTNTFCT